MSNATRPIFITCARCGEQSPVAGDGPIPIYCGTACRSAANKIQAKADGRSVEWERRRLERLAASQEARNQARLATARPCPYCAAPMTNPRRVQCGAPDCKRQFRNERQAAFQNKHKAEHGVYYSKRYDKPKQFPIVCAHCGIDAIVTKATATYCSHACWQDTNRKAHQAQHAQVELAWRPILRRPRTALAVPLRPVRQRWYSGRCLMCSSWFIADSPVDRYCSSRCGRRASKDRRRALERAAFVEHVSRTEVYERDRWTCQLCREAVLRDEVVPHPQAPTLDHVIALAKGGTHELANVQLAHFYCNTIKNDGEWQEAGRPPAPWE